MFIAVISLSYTFCVVITYYATDVNRRQVRPTFCKNVKNGRILSFGEYIWNHHEECIQIRTNIPSIGLAICEIGFEI